MGLIEPIALIAETKLTDPFLVKKQLFLDAQKLKIVIQTTRNLFVSLPPLMIAWLCVRQLKVSGPKYHAWNKSESFRLNSFMSIL